MIITLEFKCKACLNNFPREAGRINKKGQFKEAICQPCRSIRAQAVGLKIGRPERRKNNVKSLNCDICGFIGHSCQRDIHHIDGDPTNNDQVNLMTLCANCHRLVTQYQRLNKPFPSKASDSDYSI